VTPGGQTETATCGTSAVNPTTSQNSPAAAGYHLFAAGCNVTPSTGAAITSAQCPSTNLSGNPTGSPATGNPAGVCSIVFQPQPGVTYTINSKHALWFYPSFIFDGIPDPACPQGPPIHGICWWDPEGFYSFPVGRVLPSYSTQTASITQEVTGTGVPQIVPSVVPYLPGDNLAIAELWSLALSSAPWKVRCSDVLQGSVTHYLVSPTEINATFIPNFGFTLAQAAQVCGFIEFDWQQTITSWPRSSALTQAVTLAPLYAPPSFNDPPAPYGYDTDQPGFADPLPVYYNPFTDASDEYALINYETDTTLYFDDGPADDCLPGGKATSCGGKNDPVGSILAFTTHLVGLKGDLPGAAIIDTGIGFSWTSNFNGTHGGIPVSRSNGPVDPGSGTGGITITATSNATNYGSSTSAPPILLYGDQISTAGSGLAYSRVSRVFVGTLTITNNSDSTITGPFQIVLDSLQSNVTLTNATGSFGGWPYITVPSATSLDPNESATVAVRFSNPTNEILNYYPTVYSGSFD
jgi:hypothetical protein